MILLSWERPPRLNQAFDSDRSSGSSIWSNPITRRSFLKRSGGATVAVLVAANVDTAKAETVAVGDSASEYWHTSGNFDLSQLPENMHHHPTKVTCVVTIVSPIGVPGPPDAPNNDDLVLQGNQTIHNSFISESLYVIDKITVLSGPDDLDVGSVNGRGFRTIRYTIQISWKKV